MKRITESRSAQVRPRPRRGGWILPLLVILLGAAVAQDEQEVSYAWTGGNSETIEPFTVDGKWQLTLGAWCFEGIGFVRAVIYDAEDNEVDRVTVLGEGIEVMEFDTPPGEYYIDVVVSHWHTYTWEILAESITDAEPVADAPPVTVSEQSPIASDGIVEIEMRTEGSLAFFDPIGVWVEPGTTIRFHLVDGAHDTQAYHPDNDTALTRIPPGAEPWDSGLLGGLINPGKVFEVTLTEEGVYDYFCLPHEAYGMVGRIIVGNPEAFPAQPDDELPEGAQAVLPEIDTIMAAGAVYFDVSTASTGAAHGSH